MSVEGSPSFSGFKADDLKLIRLPEAFFTQLLPELNDPSQLRLLLYLFWHMEQQKSQIRYFKLEEMTSDPALINMIGNVKILKEALEGLIALGVVLKAELEWLGETLYFINGPQGQAAVEAIQRGEWQDSSGNFPPIQLRSERPNIYQLYEENIGTITPMLAEMLKADEAEYSSLWIEEAIRIAVTRNVRNWKYVQAILERWKKEGRGNEKDRRNDWKDSGSYRESWLGHE